MIPEQQLLTANPDKPKIPRDDMEAIEALYFGNEDSKETTNRSRNAFRRKLKNIKNDLQIIETYDTDTLWTKLMTARPVLR